MRGANLIAIILALSSAAHAGTALDAIKIIPPPQAARIARVEGREGSPEPGRWYILTQDPAADNGVHEFVVQDSQIVASRSLSQFAEALAPEEILDALPAIDSDKAGKVAQDYAAANGAIVSTISYDLKKDGPGATPAWTISCLDDKGAKLGSVVLSASTGDVLSHDGFPIEPTPAPVPSPTAESEIYVKSYVESPRHHHPSATPKKPANPVVNTFDKVGRTLQKLLPF